VSGLSGAGARAVLLAACAFAAGCASLSSRIAEPYDVGPSAEFAPTLERALSIREGAVTAREGNRIAYRLVAAAEYGLTTHYARRPDGVEFRFKTQGAPKPRQAVGTVVYLHGWGLDHASMLPWALALAEQGYGGVLPDLRHHGESAPAPPGYGAREAGDVAALVKALERDGQLTRPLYLFGVSYGGGAALLAALDGKVHPQGVIAMAPMIVPADAIHRMVATMRDDEAHSLRAKLRRAWVRRWYTPARVEHQISAAGRRLRVDLRSSAIADALRDPALPCTALVQGGADGVVDPATARVFASPRVRYLELEQDTHFTLPLRVDLLAPVLAQWLLSTVRCPPLILPTPK
jgi:pimeloyl-ACP methyl ester carboxylesterase